MGTTSVSRHGRARFDTAEFRRVLSHVPTAVAVVTANANGVQAGLVIGTFVSISLNPPLVGMFVAETSTSWPVIEAAGAFAVNVLSSSQSELCARFAQPGGDKFAGLALSVSENGHPILEDCVAYLDCEIRQIQTIGDHRLVVADVLSVIARDVPAPLVFFRGRLS